MDKISFPTHKYTTYTSNTTLIVVYPSIIRLTSWQFLSVYLPAAAWISSDSTEVSALLVDGLLSRWLLSVLEPFSFINELLLSFGATRVGRDKHLILM